MNDLLIGLVGALMASNQPAALSNLVVNTTGLTVAVADANDPVEQEYLKLLAADNAAQAEVDQWIRAEQNFSAQGVGKASSTLNLRIEQRLAPVRKAYEEFLQRHPRHTRARLAYGSFLNDLREEEEAGRQWEKARELDPNNPAAWNNLANHYSHGRDATKSLQYYAKAIELNPNEPVYHQNYAIALYAFRRYATNLLNLTEPQVLAKSMESYRRAIQLDPQNFPLATEYAQTYYGLKPPQLENAIAAWKYALKIANDDIERQGVYLHLARQEILAQRFDAARGYLQQVTLPMYLETKATIGRNLEKKEAEAKAAPPQPK